MTTWTKTQARCPITDTICVSLNARNANLSGTNQNSALLNLADLTLGETGRIA
jgi:hypothetical protein